jgi:hypothetical protein
MQFKFLLNYFRARWNIDKQEMGKQSEASIGQCLPMFPIFQLVRVAFIEFQFEAFKKFECIDCKNC